MQYPKVATGKNILPVLNPGLIKLPRLRCYWKRRGSGCERAGERAGRRAGGISAERRNWKQPRPPLWNSEAWRSSRRVPTVICLTNSRQPAGHIFFIKRANVCVLTQHLWSGCGGVLGRCCCSSFFFWLLLFFQKKFFNKPNCVHKGGGCLLMLRIEKTAPPFFFPPS